MAVLKFKCTNCGNEYSFDAYRKDDTSQTKEYWRNLQGSSYGLCQECYQAKKKAEWEEKNQQATQRSKEQGLPALTGTEKQVSWANAIREKRIKGLNEEIEDDLNSDEEISACKKALELVLSKTEAKWFIDHRYSTPLRLANKLSKGEIQ